MKLNRSLDTEKHGRSYLILLLFISVISHFPFVLKGFGEIDATKIAVSVIDMINHGPDAAFSNYYFTDVVPLYILYLKWSMKLFDYNYSYLPVIMNYTNAIVGTLAIIPAYLLIKRLFGSFLVAFCSVLALIFSPSFYQSTIMGFPHLIAFFFLLISLCFYLSGIDQDLKGRAYFQIFLSCIFLTVAFLFKSDYVLAAGIFPGILMMRKIKDRAKIASVFLSLFMSGILFLVFRGLILGQNSGATMSKKGISDWYNYSISIPGSLEYFILQTEPIYYGAGIATFCLLVIALVYYLFRRRYDILVFIFSWAAVPTLFWMIMIGNNARHNMITTLPFLVLIILFLYEKTPKYIVVLTGMLILGNFLMTSPSFSILRPSGNLFESHALLEKRMARFRSAARDITNIDEDRIVVLGYFHNPHVIFDIMCTVPYYEAEKIGRENYRIQTDKKEYIFIYFVVTKPEHMEQGINAILNEYNLQDYVFVSATYDLHQLVRRGLETRTLDIIKRSDL